MIKSNAGYNSPEIAAAAQNIAQMFGPPSGGELAAYSTARKNNQQSNIVAQLAQNPEYQGFDHQAILADLYDPTSSFQKVNMDDATSRRGQDVTAATSRANNFDDNRTDLISDLYSARDPYHTQPALPGDIAGSFDLSPVPAMPGLPKPLSQTEVLGTQTQRLIDGGMIGDDDLMTLIMKGTDGSAAQERITRMAQNLLSTGTVTDPKIANDLAIGIVDGRLKESRHPVTGEVVVIDMATGQPANLAAAPAPGGSGDPIMDIVTEPDAPEFGRQYPAADQSFGVGGALAGGVNTVLDAAGVGAPYKDIQQSQADFGVLRESLLNDISGAYGRQPPSWLLQEIRSLTPAAGSPFEGTGSAVSKLNAIGRHLTNELQIAQQALRRDLSPANQQEVEATLSGLQAGIARVQTALDAFGPQGGGQPPGDAPDADGWVTLPNGVRIREKL